jgi:hypothetical protein
VAQENFIVYQPECIRILQRDQQEWHHHNHIGRQVESLSQQQRHHGDDRHSEANKEQFFPVSWDIEIIGDGKKRIEDNSHPCGCDMIPGGSFLKFGFPGSGRNP